MRNKPPVFVPVELNPSGMRVIYSGNPSVNKIYKRFANNKIVHVKSEYHNSARFIINFLKKRKSIAQKYDKYVFYYTFKYKDNRRRDISNYIKIIEDIIFANYLEDDDNKVHRIVIRKVIDKSLEANEIEIKWEEYKADGDESCPYSNEEIELAKKENDLATYRKNVKKKAKKYIGVYKAETNSIILYFNANMSFNFMYRNRKGFGKPIPVYKNYVQKTLMQINKRFPSIEWLKTEKYKFLYHFYFNSKRRRDISNYIKTFEDFIFDNILLDDDKNVYEIEIRKGESKMKDNIVVIKWEPFTDSYQISN